MRDLVAMESLKLRKRLMTQIVFGLITVGTIFFMSIGYLTSRTNEYASPIERQDQLNGFLLPEVFANLSSVIGGLGSILLVMLAASMIGSEYGWGTVRVLVSSGVSRSRLLTAKLLAMIEAIVLFVASGLVAGLVGSLAITFVGGHELSTTWLNGQTLGDIAMIALRLVFLLLVPALVGFTVALVTRSLAVGIAVGIGFQIAEQILSAVLNSIGNFGERVRDLLFTTNLAAIDQYNEIGTPEVSADLPGVWQAVALLTLYTAIMLAVSFIVFRRRDIASGS
jgi:ABC-type transport system involved in multi-copper enzyme maturation permease subunit